MGRASVNGLEEDAAEGSRGPVAVGSGSRGYA